MVLIAKTHLVVHAQMFWVKGLAKGQLLRMSGKDTFTYFPLILLDSNAVSIFVVILVELTNTVFVNSTNITTNIETAVLSTLKLITNQVDIKKYLVLKLIVSVTIQEQTEYLKNIFLRICHCCER